MPKYFSSLILFAIRLLFCLQAYSLTSRGEFSLFSHLCLWNTINFFLLCKWTLSMLLNSIAQCLITPCSLSFSLFPPTANFSTMIFPFFPQSDTSSLTNLPQLSPSSPSYPLSSLSLFFSLSYVLFPTAPLEKHQLPLTSFPEGNLW